MVEAKDLATFIIEPVGADIMNPDTYLVRKRFQDTETTTSYASNAFSHALQQISTDFCESASSVGCRIWLKNGLYEIDQGPDTNGGLVEWSTEAEGDHVSVFIEGETRDGCIIRNIETAPEETPVSRVFLVRCNFDIRNLSMDGGGVIANTLNAINAFGSGSDEIIVQANNVRFGNFDGNNIGTGTDRIKAGIVENCIFEKPVSDQGQVDLGLSTDENSFGRIVNNHFDKTNGSFIGSGSSITVAGGESILVSNNTIKRNQGFFDFGISVESNFGSFNQVAISNNIIDNGRIFIGSSGAWSTTTKNVWVTGNKMFQGGIYVRGPDSGGGILQDVFIENNQLVNSWKAGIHLNKVTGLTTIRNNFIKNSNIDATANTGQEPLIMLEASTDTICERNSLYMGVVSPPDSDVSTHGIRYANLVNPTIRNNTIINRTVGNPSYESIGTHTGTVLISRNL